MSNSPDAINKRVQGWRKMEVIDVGDGNNIIRPEDKKQHHCWQFIASHGVASRAGFVQLNHQLVLHNEIFENLANPVRG
jgi:hypothetical protein